MWLVIFQCIFAIFYITGNYVFPKPLSAKEERYYLLKLKEGDMEARNVLIERNMRLVAHIVKKYSGVNKRDVDDLISIGTIGLIKGISTFNMDKGTRLATYVARCIENELLMMLRTDKKTRNEVSLQDPIGVDKEGNSITLNDILECDDEPVIEQVDLKIKIIELYDKIKNVLKEREQTVIEMRYGLLNGEEKTQREVAKILGISRSYVSRIEKKALCKLSREFENR